MPSLFLFSADNVATAKLLKRATRNFTSSVSDSQDHSIADGCVCKGGEGSCTAMHANTHTHITDDF